MLIERGAGGARCRPAICVGWRRVRLRRVARMLALALVFTTVCAQCAVASPPAAQAPSMVAAGSHCHGDADLPVSSIAPGSVVVCDDCLDQTPALPSAGQQDAGDHPFAHALAALPTYRVLLDHQLRADTRAPPHRRSRESVSTPLTRRERLLI